jgi:protein ImuB
MFACLYSLSTPLAALIKLAEDFTPRFEVVGPVVMLDLSGLSRLFGTAREIGEQLRRASHGPVRIAIAPTQTTAAFIALGRPGLTVIDAGEQRIALASLPVSLLGELERLRLGAASKAPAVAAAPLSPAASGPPVPPAVVSPPHVGEMEDVLPYFHSSLSRTSDAAAAPHLAAGAAHREVASAHAPSCGGWSHPRDSHIAAKTGRTPTSAPGGATAGKPVAPARVRAQLLAVEDLLSTLRRWSVKTFAQLSALPPGDVYERLGARGVLWQRLAQGEDLSPLGPWVPEDPYEASLELEWPIEGLEPLSFVLARLLEPLSDRLERADRGAAILHMHLRLVDKTVHARTLQLPAPMRDPKTLRTLVLLDLESNPPSTAIDRVRVLVEPTPARVTQWALFERAQPSPEQVSTLLARLIALMGETHIGSPRLVDSWKPGAFEMHPFQVQSSKFKVQSSSAAPGGPVAPAPMPPAAPVPPVSPVTSSALRRFRLPVPARVHVQDGRPVRVLVDRRGVTGGPVLQAAGPWRTSGEWWNDGSGRWWDRDEWDVAIADGTVYRLYVERDIGQWFLEGVVD